MSKSLTEFIELFQEFVEFLTGKKVKVPIVFQDCSAVVSLVMKGGGITRTKHLCARMNLGKIDGGSRAGTCGVHQGGGNEGRWLQ